MSLWENSENRASLQMIDVAVAAALAITVFYEWWPTLSTRFYQDDYWHLFLAQNPSLGIIPGMIPWAQDWRPLGTFAPFYLMRGAFGLNPFAFHLTNLAVHLLNGLLVYRVGLVMTGARRFALMAAIFYSLHFAHTRSQQWAAGIDNLLSTLWYLTAFSMYLQYRQYHRRWAYWISLIAFGAALLTKEWSVSFVAIILWYEFVCGLTSSLRQRESWRAIMIPAVGYGILLCAYLSVRILLFDLPSEGQYGLNSALLPALGNFAEYLRFAAFVVSGFEPALEATTVAVIVVSFLLMFFLSLFYRWQLMSFGLGWFVIALSPVLFISRLEPYFLAIPLVGFSLAVTAFAVIMVQSLPFAALKSQAALALAGILYAVMLTAGAHEVRLQQQAPWLVTPQRFADCTLAYLSSRWPLLPADSLLFFRDFTADEHYFLGLGSAINVHYNDNTIRSAFIPHDKASYSPFVNVIAMPSPLEQKIVDRTALAVFCPQTLALGLE